MIDIHFRLLLSLFVLFSDLLLLLVLVFLFTVLLFSPLLGVYNVSPCVLLFANNVNTKYFVIKFILGSNLIFQ